MNEYHNMKTCYSNIHNTQRIKESFTHTLRYLLRTPNSPHSMTHTPNNIWGFRSRVLDRACGSFWDLALSTFL